MKKSNPYFCLLLLAGFIQMNGKLAAEDYSKMSREELDARFISAVKAHHSEKVEELIQAGASVDTPIRYTITAGDCDWEIQSSALLYAVRDNCPNMVKALVKVDKKLNKALHVAIEEGYLDVVKELIKGGADVNYLNDNKDSPLILAIEDACATEEFSSQAQVRARSRWYQRRQIIEMLLKKGAHVSHVNESGETALMKAVIEHDLNTVQKLLQVPEMTRGSYFGFGTKPINYADKDGNTALMLSIENVIYTYVDNQEYNICKNSQEIVKVLLETPGIDVDHVNKNGETAITLLEKLNKQINMYPY
jgi:ankyrin repeat protein